MAGIFPLVAEIAGRANQTGSEVVLPNSIGHHAGGEWIFLGGYPAGELQATRIPFRDNGFRGVDRAQETAEDGLAFFGGISLFQ